ncbi:MAG: hypothetical protein QOJ90_771 [Actinomycetota bacterium]|jgi:membrane-associated phospholipid phosphatase|nr:hypothetical protein [Actinomycetota bacterium]
MTRAARIGGRFVLMLAVLYALLLWLGVAVTSWLRHRWPLADEDAVNRSLVDNHSAFLDRITDVLTRLGGVAVVAVTTAVVALALRLLLKRWREPLFFVLAVTGELAVWALTALAIDRARPDVRHLDTVVLSSFPSGPTGAVTAVCIAAAALVAWHVTSRPGRLGSIGLLAGVPLAVGWAAMYRGAAHPTDVAGAYLGAAGSVSVAGAALLNRRWWGERADPP